MMLMPVTLCITCSLFMGQLMRDNELSAHLSRYDVVCLLTRALDGDSRRVGEVYFMTYVCVVFFFFVT